MFSLHRFYIQHFLHREHGEKARIEVRNDPLRHRRYVGLSLYLLHKQIRLDAAYRVVALDLLIAEAVEEFAQLPEPVGIRILKLRQLRDDPLLVGIALVYQAHDLYSKPLTAAPRHDRQILQLPADKAMSLQYIMISPAVEVAPNSQGRIPIPQTLRESAGLEKEAVVVGMDSRVEIWDKAKFEEFMRLQQQNLSGALELLRL